MSVDEENLLIASYSNWSSDINSSNGGLRSTSSFHQTLVSLRNSAGDRCGLSLSRTRLERRWCLTVFIQDEKSNDSSSSRSIKARVDSENSWNNDHFPAQRLLDTKWSEYERKNVDRSTSLLWLIRSSIEHSFNIAFIYLFNSSPLSSVQFSSACCPPSIDQSPISIKWPLGSYWWNRFVLISDLLPFIQNQSSRHIAITGVNGGIRRSSNRRQWGQCWLRDDRHPDSCRILGDCHAQFNARQSPRNDADSFTSLHDGTVSMEEWLTSHVHE